MVKRICVSCRKSPDEIINSDDRKYCFSCVRDRKNFVRRKTIHIRPGPYHIDDNFFNMKEINNNKSFWYGFFIARSSIHKNGHHVIFSGLNAFSYKVFCSDLKSNYVLNKEGQVKMSNKRVFNAVNNLYKRYTSIPIKYQTSFMVGYLATMGTIRRSNDGENCVGKSFSVFCIESIYNEILSFIRKILLRNKIEFTYTKRLRNNKIIHMVKISKADSFIKLNDLIKSIKNYNRYSDIYHTINIISCAYEEEFARREKLIIMIKSDSKKKLPINHMSSKYGINIKVIGRIQSGMKINKMLINTLSMKDHIESFDRCSKCNIFTIVSLPCIYCAGEQACINKSYSVANRDYSAQIRAGLERLIMGKDVSNHSIQKYLGYTFIELKCHMEDLFEEWMNWDNWGSYSARKWDQNDRSTWVWNIDHIKPQSTFKFRERYDPQFKVCWALSNIRPYSARQNIKDGASKIRHT